MQSKNFSIKQLTTVDDVVEAGKMLNNAASVPTNAQRYLHEGFIYIAEELVNPKLNLVNLLDKKETKYLILVTKELSLVGSHYFSGYAVCKPTKEDAKEIVETMLKSGAIKEDETSRQYLE